jgi:Flp pilus assembly protein TadG
MYLARRSRRQQRPATTVVETAFIGVILFAFMFAIFEFGRVVMMLQVMNNAGRMGARQAVVTATSYISPSTATSNITTTVQGALAGQNLQNLNIQLYQADSSGNNIGAWTSAPFGQNIIVQIDADFPLMLPTWGFIPHSGTYPNSIHLQTKCMMRGEAN